MTKEISMAEVCQHNSRENGVWMVIHDDVYDVTKFLEEHPGGEETLLDVAGKEATREFEDVGHSEDARTILKKYKIGTMPENDRRSNNREACGCWIKLALLVLVGSIIAGCAYRKFSQ